MDSLANALGLNADAPDAGSGKTGNLSTLVPDTTSLATVRQAEAVSKLEAAKATADEATEDLAVGGACDIWYLATGADGGRGRDADWDAIKKSGVQHFKMVLPEPEEAPYIWDKDPELREVRRLYEYGFAELFDIGGDDGDATDRPAERGYFFSSAEKVLSSDLIFYCLKGGVYVDFRHHPEPTRWVRAHLEPGDMLQVPEGALYRFSLPTATTVNKAAGHIGPKTTGTTPGTQIVVLTKEAPSAATMKVPLTLDALARYEAQHGEPHPSVQRYRHLFARPKVTGLAWFFEPTPDINYNVIVGQQAFMCALGSIMLIWAQFSDDVTGFWLMFCPFPLMLVWSLFARANWVKLQALLEKTAIETKKER